MHIKILPFKNPCTVYEHIYTMNSVLLESQKNGRYSYTALNPWMIFKSKGKKIEITTGVKKKDKNNKKRQSNCGIKKNIS